jgi:hypothetical protein
MGERVVTILAFAFVCLAAIALTIRACAVRALEIKAKQSQRCLESLEASAGIEDGAPVEFVASPRRLGRLLAACLADNPFPRYRAILCFIRLRGVVRLFRREKVLQTPAAAAALAACDKTASRIARLRKPDLPPGGQTRVDVAFAGLQALRLYFAASNDEAFSRQRFESCFRVNNAWNGSFYKYRTRDGRLFSFHVYYQSQKRKMVEALKIAKAADAFTMSSSKADRGLVGEVVSRYDAAELEELAFSSGASGCVLRSREEWEATEVGKAVLAMPLVSVRKVGGAGPRRYPNFDPERGPLSGIKVLDLTHIIAGPACTRLLAEYGADVLLVRRGGFDEQEQSFLELDGWAGKRSIQLDFEKADELSRAKELVAEADAIVYSYQGGALDRFGLSEADIRRMNPRAIYCSLMCFSDAAWKRRPGWAPLAEDIAGLSVRNGSRARPKNLNGVPLDYIPGFVLALGALRAIERSMSEGGAFDVTASLTRTAMWLHECTDLCAKPANAPAAAPRRARRPGPDAWASVLARVVGNAVGDIGFPAPAASNPSLPDAARNMRFSDGEAGWRA